MFSRMRRAAIALLAIYWLILFMGTHLPISGKGMGDNGDKVLHFIAFAMLAFLMSAGIGGRRPTWRAFAVVLAACAIYAGFDEFSQLLVGRHCDVWDWVADILGTATGLVAFWVVTTISHTWRQASRPDKAEVVMR